MASPVDVAAKRGFIEAFFDELESKAELTSSLFDQGHEDEARLLCCCYIEALGNWLEGSGSFGSRNFIEVLKRRGGEPVLALILPSLLTRSLPYDGCKLADCGPIRASLSALPEDEALAESNLLSVLRPFLSATAIAFLERELWRGTIASYAYSQIRSLGAHWFGSPGAVSFSGMKYESAPLPDIDFLMLKRALDRIISYARHLSLSTNKWFGHS